MYDTHCHLTFEQYAGPGVLDDVIRSARSAGVRGMITISTTSDNAPDCLAIAERFPEVVWCSAGVHPLYSDRDVDWSLLREVAAHPRCVAWGEMGLDNHYDTPPRETQDRVLERHLAEIEASGIGKPVIIHCREAFDDVIPILASSHLDPQTIVFHCFTGTPGEARAVLDLGAWISFTGVVTFRNAPQVAEAAALVPDDRIMVETDAPFLTPAPHRKVWPNEPKYVVHVAERIAALRGIDPAAFEATLDANAERFFGIRAEVPTSG